ncbi:TrlF family AAA-like ATPase [Aquimarina macrocephali]|uniref:TrlF family AAA-like ATPase n=1 Tax=Aquimarina macrocephali TaxID=666563 RepID=UPI000467AB4D|nr:AAA family ATPase [Aquimarina macrocephali]
MIDDSDKTNNLITNEIVSPKGSVWHRWEPHIHMPGTIKADKFSGDNVIQQYLEKIKNASPPIRAIGITDYCVLDSYEKLLVLHKEGKLPNVELIFPNIELRYPVNAEKGSPINVHLLVCPDDADHIEKTKRFLRDLKFEFDGEKYGCTNDELIRLGRAFNPEVANDTQALKLGVEQTKISPEILREAFKAHKWARENIMVATAAGQGDGLGQIQESGLKAVREELQRMSHIIFSGRPGDKTYWSGKGADTSDTLKQKYGSLKPCLHGSDAHDLATVGEPDEDRYCWIKGDITFETLRQICFEPNGRVYIGKEKPIGGLPSDIIAEINVKNANWLKTPNIPINSGLVAIIGARGSGKTALVEMIAAGADSVDNKHTKRSFLERAKDYLTNTTSKLVWGNEESTESTVNVDLLTEEREDPRVRYLSQQFVDQLCSSDGLADELIEAIERVIYEAHAPENRLGARSFKELRDIKTEAVYRNKNTHQETLKDIGSELSIQNDLQRSLEDLKKKRTIENTAIVRLKKDRKKLTPTDDKEILKRLEDIRTEAENKSLSITTLEKQQLKLNSLKEEAEQFLETGSSMQLEQLKQEYEEVVLTEDQWKKFSLTYEGDVDALLDEQIKKVDKEIKKLKGPNKEEKEEILENLTKAPPYFDENAILAELTYTLLTKEQRRLEALIGVDKAKRKNYIDLSKRITRAEAALKLRDKEITKSETAPAKIKELLEQREQAYKNLVGEIEKEAKLLKKLYKPLQDRLDEQKGTLNKLTFSVNRNVDLEAWSLAGERLIDKSRTGAFRGVGKLTEIIETELENTWKNGKANEIAKAMSSFRAKYGQSFRDHAHEDARKNRESQKHWYAQVSSWLYSIDHISVNYGLEYEGVDIKQLSPGTRGIVLLLLYLSIDIDDRRPLIIDQPEENLDPESIFHELVGRFKEAKSRRQVIIVTHNANLVVNTDADQVIVASRGAHKRKSLPDIEYISGGLENPEIRKSVCAILEGGKEAFEERARRLRIKVS